jgi:hypothetical protein
MAVTAILLFSLGRGREPYGAGAVFPEALLEGGSAIAKSLRAIPVDVARSAATAAGQSGAPVGASPVPGKLLTEICSPLGALFSGYWP